MNKQQALDHWRSLTPNQNPMRHFQPIPYKAEGSSYGACGVRIDGSPEFVDAVLSCLKPLLEAEGIETRLELSRAAVKPRPGKPLHKADAGAQVCYIRRHMRGSEGAIMQGFLQAVRNRPGKRRPAASAA